MVKIIPSFFAALATVLHVAADSLGTTIWAPPFLHDQNMYTRVIQLQYADSDNGKMLSTWEHDFSNQTAAGFVIRQSTDNGQTWSTVTTLFDPQTGNGHPAVNFWEPFLFEFPTQLGNYPAGTILLVGNLADSPGYKFTQFFAWRSTDHGQTWTVVGPWQNGNPSVNGTSHGIWEPFLFVDKAGTLIAVFSDERDPAHSQKLVQVQSTDGGDTWSSPYDIVAASTQTFRPGMGIISLMGNGQYFMSYEVCNDGGCPVHCKVSDDGTTWSSSDIGTAVQTDDDLWAQSAPYNTWDPVTGSIILGSWNIHLLDTGATFNGSKRSLFINSNNGQGTWSWAPSPWSPNPNCYRPMYSPNLLALDGTIRLSTASGQPSTLCEEKTGTFPIAQLPYTADFSEGDAGWADFGGSWSTSGNTYTVAAGSGEDSIAYTGSTGWTDYTLSATLKVTGQGAAGLLARVTKPAQGVNSFQGYLASINNQASTLKISKIVGGNQIDLASASVQYQENATYTLSLSVNVGNIQAVLSGGSLSSNVTVSQQDSTYGHGLVGLLAREDVGATFGSVGVTGS